MGKAEQYIQNEYVRNNVYINKLGETVAKTKERR